MFLLSCLFRTNIISAILATAAALSLSISMALAKQLGTEIPTVLVVFVRGCFGLLCLIPFFIHNRTKITTTTKLPLHLLRIVLSVGTMMCTYYTYRNLPVAIATSIGMTGALFTIVLSVFILKESIGFWKWIVVFIGYCGVILVIRPKSFSLEFAIITALLANILNSCCIIIAKILSKYDSTITIMFYTTIGITIIAGILTINSWQSINGQDTVIIFCCGILGITAQFCSITAIKYSSPSFIAPFEYIRIFFAILIGIIIFREILDVLTILGSAIIICSTYASARYYGPTTSSERG